MPIDILKGHIIKTLLYYDVFNYPLRATEIYQFLGTANSSLEEVQSALTELTLQNKIFLFDTFYAVREKKELITRRVQGNHFADQLAPLAFRRAKLISRFPFVRAVMASGSFSKNYMDSDSDLDFFIVTTPGRLWIVRMLLALYKRVVFLNSYKTFCCNYFVDTENMEIEEKNIFTATELATLIPLYDRKHYQLLLRTNNWIYDYFPNFVSRAVEDVLECPPPFFKKFWERVLSGKIGNQIDSKLLRLNQRRLERLYKNRNTEQDFKIAFKSRKSVSKNHPRVHQARVIEKLAYRIEWFEKVHHMEVNTSQPVMK